MPRELMSREASREMRAGSLPHVGAGQARWPGEGFR